MELILFIETRASYGLVQFCTLSVPVQWGRRVTKYLSGELSVLLYGVHGLSCSFFPPFSLLCILNTFAVQLYPSLVMLVLPRKPAESARPRASPLRPLTQRVLFLAVSPQFSWGGRRCSCGSFRMKNSSSSESCSRKGNTSTLGMCNFYRRGSKDTPFSCVHRFMQLFIKAVLKNILFLARTFLLVIVKSRLTQHLSSHM